MLWAVDGACPGTPLAAGQVRAPPASLSARKKGWGNLGEEEGAQVWLGDALVTLGKQGQLWPVPWRDLHQYFHLTSGGTQGLLVHHKI